MANLNVHGQENVVAPGFYMPNRLSVQACKTLNYLLQGRLCYITDEAFPLRPDVEQYLKEKRIAIHRFDFRHSTPLAARERVQGLLRAGKSVDLFAGTVGEGSWCAHRCSFAVSGVRGFDEYAGCASVFGLLRHDI